jgi:hypothetical protein
MLCNVETKHFIAGHMGHGSAYLGKMTLYSPSGPNMWTKIRAFGGYATERKEES